MEALTCKSAVTPTSSSSLVVAVGVVTMVVVGVPDARWGERVEALITVREAADSEDIQQFCRTRIAGYKVPRTIWIVDDLNRQPSGKPDYRWAREWAIALGKNT